MVPATGAGKPGIGAPSLLCSPPMKRVPSPPVDPRPTGAWLGGLVVATCAAWVFRGALGQFFAADDFSGLARGAGLLPRLHGPWRLLSHQLYFDLMHHVAGLDPRAYHAASLLLHVGCAVALYALLKRRLGVPAAMAGAACFAAHPAHFAATYWVAAVGVPLSLLAALGALLVAPRRDRARWLALPLFAAALLARESVILLPLVVPLWLRHDDGAGRGPVRSVRPDPLVLAAGALALAQLAVVVITDAMGARAGAAAYRLDFGPALWANLLSYAGWTANFLLATVRRVQDGVDPLVYGWGAALLVLWLAGLAWPALRRRGWLVAGALYLALLSPVLPLGSHTYRYYLYGPLAGFSWGIAAALDVLLTRIAGAPRRAPRRGVDRRSERSAAAWATALALVALGAVNGSLLVHKIATMPFAGAPGLYSDAVVDRAAIARRALEGLRGAALPDHARLLFWSPIGRAQAPGPARESYFELNVRAALFDGLAVRVFFPGVDSVRFVTDYRPLPEPYRYAVYRPDGGLAVASSATLDSVLAASAP
jgi:hypothetical protein